MFGQRRLDPLPLIAAGGQGEADEGSGMVRARSTPQALPGHLADNEPRPVKRSPERPWALAFTVAVVAVVLMVLVVVVAPRYLLDWDAHGTPVADRAKAINDIRTTLLQGLAGLALLVGAFFTWRQVQVSQHSQITGRFTAAVEQLGSASAEVRIGALFALERIAGDCREDRDTIAEVLCSFVQRNALAAPLAARPVPRDTAHKGELARTHGGDAPLALRAADVQIAVRVLGRRTPLPRGHTLRLSRVDLRRSRLESGDFADPDLHYADLTETDLRGADLRRADLTGTWIAGAVLIGADLRQADLRTAVVWHTRLESADLRATDLTGADLTCARVDGARFDLADLRGADLTGTNLGDATLTGAVADTTTVWPSGFDATAAGVLPAHHAPPLRPQTWLSQPPGP
ncbi:pentapeptide repeat-containing protein [Streptomyces sp. T-3]|nr:pentapeptide repeat-containing protein [Streptomyces sp. T-3]